jgi:hypothetical protein
MPWTVAIPNATCAATPGVFGGSAQYKKTAPHNQNYTRTQMTRRLSLDRQFSAFDNKDRDFYDSLTDEERKDFGLFLMIRYGSCVKESADFQEWYIRATNDRLNKNFFDIGKHPRLQWLVCTTVSPGMGRLQHEWIGLKKRASEGNKTMRFLKNQFPHLKEDELQLLGQLNGNSDLKNLARELGWSDKDITREL